MLTGTPPHTGASAQQIIMKIVTEEAVPVTRLRKAVPPNLAAAVAKALEKLPADRFATAKEFAEALANPANTGGAMPRWSSGGLYFYFWNTGPMRVTLMRARVDVAPFPHRGESGTSVFDIGSLTGDWDLHPDGRHFIIVETASESQTAGDAADSRARHLLHLNLFTTLRATVKRGKR